MISINMLQYRSSPLGTRHIVWGIVIYKHIFYFFVCVFFFFFFLETVYTALRGKIQHAGNLYHKYVYSLYT